jgi:hypothetical protein
MGSSHMGHVTMGSTLGVAHIKAKSASARIERPILSD